MQRMNFFRYGGKLMKKITAKALAVLMACTMIPATLPIVSNAEVNDVIDGTSAVLYSHDASDRPMESLNRGLVVQALNGGNYLSWRLMVDEDEMYHSIYIKMVNFLQPKHIRQTISTLTVQVVTHIR